MAEERRVRLLVSVVTAGELEAALTGGADIVVPEPRSAHRLHMELEPGSLL